MSPGSLSQSRYLNVPRSSPSTSACTVWTAMAWVVAEIWQWKPTLKEQKTHSQVIPGRGTLTLIHTQHKNTWCVMTSHTWHNCAPCGKWLRRDESHVCLVEKRKDPQSFTLTQPSAFSTNKVLPVIYPMLYWELNVSSRLNDVETLHLKKAVNGCFHLRLLTLLPQMQVKKRKCFPAFCCPTFKLFSFPD